MLDTNVISALLRGNHPKLTARSESVGIERQIIPSIVRAELMFGWYDSPNFASRVDELGSFSDCVGSVGSFDLVLGEVLWIHHHSLPSFTGGGLRHNRCIASPALKSQAVFPGIPLRWAVLS